MPGGQACRSRETSTGLLQAVSTKEPTKSTTWSARYTQVPKASGIKPISQAKVRSVTPGTKGPKLTTVWERQPDGYYKHVTKPGLICQANVATEPPPKATAVPKTGLNSPPPKASQPSQVPDPPIVEAGSGHTPQGDAPQPMDIDARGNGGYS